MPMSYQTENTMPYCPGCGHILATKSIVKGFEKSATDPLDIILVSDIGCCGLIDPLLTVHTVHGLHGRSTALGAGISMSLNDPNKKVVAIQGDGGATIGLQHILEGARRNINMTLIVQNNFIYGMTGGQESGLTTEEFQSEQDQTTPSYDICELADKAGAVMSIRINGSGDLSEPIAKAINTKGFSLVEIIGMCPPYGLNKIKDLEKVGRDELSLSNQIEHIPLPPKNSDSLFDEIIPVESNFTSTLKGDIKILIAGSAGESIQTAAELLASAAMSAGLDATKKGAYPITVGTGFSVAELILSESPINYTGFNAPDVLIVTSNDGLDYVKESINEHTTVIADNELDIPDDWNVTTEDFRSISGKKGAALHATAHWLLQSKLLDFEALKKAVNNHKLADKLSLIIDKAKSSEK